jgi:hypothetical protein
MLVFNLLGLKKMTDNEASSTSSYQPEQRKRLHAEYLFIFCYHTEEFADEISVALQDCDTIAIEYAGFKSEDERQYWNEMLTNYVSSAITPQQNAEIQDEFATSRGGDYPSNVLKNLRGSNKRIVLLDMDEDNPNYFYIADYWVANKSYYRAVNNGYSIQKTKEAAVAFLRAATGSFHIREMVMADQLKALGHTPGKIGVITGVIHTPTKEQLSSISETSQIVIGPEIKNADCGETVDYDYFDLAIQQARANGVESVDDSLLDREILRDIIDNYEVDLGDNNMRDLVNGLNEEQINSILHDIDEILETSATHSKGFMRILMTKNEIVKILQAMWPTIPENPKVTIREV